MCLCSVFSPQLIQRPDTPAASSVCRRPSPQGGDFSHVHYWLKDCLNNHPNHTQITKRCGSCSDSNLPKRVLDLNWDHGSTNVRLIESVEGQQGKYAALTYAWGPRPEDIFKTKPHTISQRMKGIKFDDLNPLFQQVIYVCRDLKIPYLWIDALCIIQDDKTDWEEQAPLMCDIYSNAFLTLSATDAQSPNERILRETKHSDTLAMTYHQGGQVFLQPSVEGDVRGDEARKGVVNGRGWCLQERYLSKRILHFTTKGVEWECLSTTQHESRDLSLAYDDESVLIRPHGFELGEDPYDIWYRVLQEYSRRSMTYDSDLLAGISGLAELFRRLTSDYLLDCGLWSSQPLLGLLWEHLGLTEDRRPSSNPKASWSWLNTVGAKVWRPICHPRCVAVEELAVKDETHTITLRGILLTLPSELRYYYAHRSYDEDLESPFSFLEANFDFELDDNIEEVEGGLFFLALLRPVLDMHEGRVQADMSYKGDTTGWGLLLTSADAAGKYKRVGFAEISCESFLYDTYCDIEDDQPYEEFWQKHNQDLIEVTLV